MTRVITMHVFVAPSIPFKSVCTILICIYTVSAFINHKTSGKFSRRLSFFSSISRTIREDPSENKTFRKFSPLPNEGISRGKQHTDQKSKEKKKSKKNAILTPEIFSSQLKELPKRQRWEKVEELLHLSNKSAILHPLPVYHIALEVYKAKARWREARTLINQLSEKGPVLDKKSYDLAIACCQRAAASVFACDLLKQMIESSKMNPSLAPDLYTYRGVLNAFNTTYNVRLRTSKMISSLKKRNISLTHDFYEAIIRQCLYEGEMKYATKVFQNSWNVVGTMPRASAYSVLINHFMMRQNYASALQFFEEMQAYVISPDARTYSNAIAAASFLNQPEKAAKILNVMQSKGHKPDRFCKGNVARAWKDAGNWKELQSFIRSMEQEQTFVDPYIYRKALHLLVQAEEWKSAVEVFKKLEPTWLGPEQCLTSSDVNCAINAYTQVGKWKEACRLVMDMREHGLVPDLVSYNSAINACGKAGELYEALSLLEEMEEVGLTPNLITFTTLFAACARAPYPQIALQLLLMMKRFHLRPSAEILNHAFKACITASDWTTAVDLSVTAANVKKLSFKANQVLTDNIFSLLSKMPEPSQEAYEKLLLALEKLGRPKDAVIVLTMMRKAGFMPLRSSYEAIIGACVSGGDAAGVVGNVLQMTKGGIVPNKETFSKAFALLPRSPNPYQVADRLLYLVLHTDNVPHSKTDMVPYYALAIESCAAKGEVKEAWLLLAAAMREDVLVGQETYGAVINACCKKKQWGLAMSVLEQMRIHAVTPTAIDYHRAIKAASMTYNIPKALSFMEMMGADGLQPDVICYRSVLRMCVHRKEWQLSLELLNRMQEQFGENFADGPSYHYILEALASGSEWERIPAVFAQMKAKGVQLLEEEYSLLMQVLGKQGRWQDVLVILKEMSSVGIKPTLKTCNIVLDALGKSGNWEMAEQFFHSLPKRSLEADEVTYGTLIFAYGVGKQLDKALAALDEMNTKKLHPSPMCFNNAIFACKETGNWETAVSLLSRMQRENINITCVAFRSAISACVQAGANEKAIELFFRMQNLKVEPDIHTFNVVLSACFKAGMPELASRLMVEMDESGLQRNFQTYATVITAGARLGRLDLAIQTLKQMQDSDVEQPSSSLFGAVISACFKAGDEAKVIGLFEEMTSKGIRPSNSTYTEVLKALKHQKEWQRIQEIYEQLETEGLELQFSSYKVVMSALNRLGEWSKTVQLYENLKRQGVLPYGDVVADNLAKAARRHCLEQQ